MEEGPKLLAGLDRGKEGREELLNKGVKLDCILLPKDARGASEGVKELLNKGSKELVKGTSNTLEGPELGWEGLDCPEVSKLKGSVAELKRGSTEEVPKACEEIKDGIEGVKEDCTELPIGNALGKEGKLPNGIDGIRELYKDLKLNAPKNHGLTFSLTGL